MINFSIYSISCLSGYTILFYKDHFPVTTEQPSFPLHRTTSKIFKHKTSVWWLIIHLKKKKTSPESSFIKDKVKF